MRAYVIKIGNRYLGFGLNRVPLVEAEFFPTALKARKESIDGEKVVAVDIKIVKRIN